MSIRQIPSPNFGERKIKPAPRFVILHFTAMDSAEEACERLCDPEFEVSAHYLIAQNGEIIQLVEERKRAWHAGASYWAGERDMNSASIGIELDNNGARPFEGAQYAALIKLLKEICARHDIPPQNILGHSDIAIGRKFDPGPWFNWSCLDEAGVCAPPKAKGKYSRTKTGFRSAALAAGYEADADFDALLLAIRIRHGATPYYGKLREQDFELIEE